MAKAPQSTILANFEQAAKRVFAGAASPFADLFDPNAFKDVKGLPNLNAAKKPVAGVEQVPAAAYLISKLVNPNINVPYLERAADRMLKNDQFMREHIGIGDPKNFADVALETAGSLLVPGPKGAAVVRMRPTTGLSVAGKVAAGTRKAATGTAKTVAESVIPFRQGTSIAKAAAVQVPLAVGVSEGLDAALQSPDYQSVADMVDGPVSAMDQPLESFIPEELKTIYDEAGVNQDYELQAEVLEIALDRQEKEAAKEYFPEDPAWKDPVTTAAIFGTLGIGAFGARNVARRLAGANLNPVDKLTGRGGVNDITPKGVKFQQANVQHDASLRWAGELLYGKGSADHDKFLAKLDSVTSAPLATKIQHAMTTGEMPNSAVTRSPLRATLEAIAKDLDDAEWQVVTDGLLARNALDDLHNNGVQSAFNDKTPDELAAMAHRLESDPRLAPYGDLTKQHFRDLLDYGLEQELITSRAYRELIEARPNFVHMSRNLAPDDSNSLFFSRGSTSGQTAAERNRVFSRSTEEFGGVQVGATADPLAELPGQFNRIISQAEINRVKRDFLENAVNNAELSTVIKRLPIGETPKSGKDSGIHEVLVNGIKVYYKVEDSAINAALDFSPVAAKTAVSTILGVPKKIAQTFITGAGNPEFAASSAVYDTITGIMLRPRGYDLGLLNEFKNKLLSQSALNNPVVKESSEWISRLDPTVWISAPIGALRLGYDELVGAMAHDLQARLLKSNDWFVDLIGGRQNAQALEQRLASVYNSSIKSLMDKTGATTSNQLNPQDVATQARGTVDVAPNFFARANERAYNEALEGNTSFAEATLLGSKNLFDQVRAAPLSRAYMNLVRLLHEGFRYQAFASNIGKTQERVGPYVINDTELQQLLASQTRRISADIGQTGAAQVYQEAARSAMYMNVGVQTLAEVGRKFARQPLTTTTNLVTALTMMMGMQYLYAASDPERAKEIANLTDDEQTRTVKTPLGDIPVPPELRLIWGPLTAITNEVTGINAGQMDPNFISAFEQWIDNDFDLGETGQFSLAESAKSAIRDVMPVGIGSSPVVNAIAATQGIDLAMTRFSGKPTEIQGQQISQLGGEGRLTDDAISATSQKIIQELLGTTVSDYIRSGLDADRALSGGGTLSDAARVALSRMQDNAVKQAGPLRGAFFSDYERVKNINDTEFNLWYEKKKGLDKATQTLRQDVLQQFVTGADPRFALLRNSDTIDPSYANTALAPIGAVAADLTKSLRPLQLRMNELKDQTDFTKNQKLSGIEDRNIQMNDYNEERQAIAQQMLYYTQMAEDNIRQMLGDPSFSFQNFDPKTYASMPWPPLPPEPAAQSSVGQGPQ